MSPVTVRAADPPATAAHADISQGFARLVFDLPGEADVEANVDYGVLVVKFAAPIAVDTDALKTQLGPYVAMVRQDPNRMTLRFAMRGPVRLVKSVVGRQAAIDLLPPRFKGEPPPFNGLVAQAAGPDASASLIIPSEAAERREFSSFASPATLDLVPIRVGLNPTFTRIAFDWAVPVDYTVEHQGSEVVVRFSRAARVDLSVLRTDPPKFIRSADTQIAEGKLTVIIETAPDLDVQNFRDGNSIALDFTPKGPMGDAVATVGPPHDDASVFAPKPPPAASGGDAEAVLTGRSSEASLPKAAPEAPLAPPASDAPAQLVAPPSYGHLAIGGEAPGVAFTIAFAEPVAAAAFRRGDKLWLVFDTPEPVTIDEPGRDVTPFIGEITSLAQDGAQIVRIGLKTDALIQARAEGGAWSFRVADTVTAPGEVVSVVRETPPSGSPRLRFRAAAAKLHWLNDDDLGDFVLVATAKGPPRNIPLERHFVELNALATAQGVAVTPFTEDLSARLDEGDLIVDANGGLALTVSDNIERGSTRSPVERIEDPAFLDFKIWRRGGPSSLIKTRQALEQAIIRAKDKSRNMARLDLARFYLANGYAPEALGTLKLMAKEDERVENAPAYHAMRGAALFMMGRADAAEAAFSHATLAGEPDIAVWRGAAASVARHWTAATEAFAAAERVIPRYPVTWQARFRLLAAEAALARNDINAAMHAYTAIPPAGLDSKLKVQQDYVAGRLLEAQGRGEEALTRYELAVAGPRGQARAHAILAQADLSVRLGKASEKTAIETLERLRYDWRGDTLELDTMAELGRHYLADRRYREGLSVMHAAAARFAKEEGARQVGDDMVKAFRGLFLEGGADALPPVEALALFYDFRELTPLGTEGDDIVRRLAERLVMVDLLPQAEDLLQHQVDSRLQGAARAQVAARLSTIYLLDHKPEDALRNIRATRQAQLPGWLDSERRLLEARALMELKQYDFALEVLVNDTSPEAERVRADVYWGAGNWGAAAEHIEQVLADRWRGADPLKPDERLNVMRTAICYLFNKDDFGLSSLRDRYGAAMKSTPDGPAFELVTAKPDATSANVGELAKKIAAADTLDAFMAAFKARQVAGAGGTASVPAETAPPETPKTN